MSSTSFKVLQRYDVSMGYKILGFLVWHGGKWWVRRRISGAPVKAALAGAGALVVAGAIVAARQASAPE